MSGSAREKALRAVRAAQAKFEGQVKDAHTSRREAFVKAQEEGLSLRDIGDEIGLDRSRVGQIIRGE